MPRIKYLDRHSDELLDQYLKEKHFTVKEAAEILRISPLTLKKKRLSKTKPGPPYIKLGYRTVVYPRKALAQYMQEHNFFSTSEDFTILLQKKFQKSQQPI